MAALTDIESNHFQTWLIVALHQNLSLFSHAIEWIFFDFVLALEVT